MSEGIKTLCPYCGVGCGLEVLPPAQTEKPRTETLRAIRCGKFVAIALILLVKVKYVLKEALLPNLWIQDRLKYPMMRDSLNDQFRRVSWSEALTKIVDRIQEVRHTQGSDAICMYGSGAVSDRRLLHCSKVTQRLSGYK